MAQTRHQKVAEQGEGGPVSKKVKRGKKQSIMKESSTTQCNVDVQAVAIETRMNEWIDSLQDGSLNQDSDEPANDQNIQEVSMIDVASHAIESTVIVASKNDQNVPTNDQRAASDIGMLPPTIEFDDIADEISYWESAFICYILGANPPFKVMEGFAFRMWKKFDLDKIVGIGKGVYLVRFHSKENMLNVCNGDHLFFDSKPLIMKPWSPEIDIMKDDIKTFPLWIKFPGLDLKYWGTKALSKISSGVGKFVKQDGPTLNKDRLQFARVLVETDLESPLPDTISFINEKGVTITQSVVYDWKPVLCSTCKRFGHAAKDCKSGALKSIKRWVPKAQQPQAVAAQQVSNQQAFQQQPQQQALQQQLQRQSIQQPDDEGFIAVKKKASTPQKSVASSSDNNVSLVNKYDVLTGKNIVEDTPSIDTAQVCVMAAHDGVETPTGHG